MTEEAMSRAIENLKTSRNRNGLKRYCRLQESLSRVDVRSDRDFQRAFRSFYRVMRGNEWCEPFFSILEREKNNPAPSFREALDEIHYRTGRVEASFSSKLVATIDANRPVWDRHVLANLGLRPPYSGMDTRRRLDRCSELYSKIRKWTSAAIRQDSFAEWRRRFDGAFPQFKHFTDIKKLDLFLWQSRRSERSGHASGSSSPGTGGVSGASSR